MLGWLDGWVCVVMGGCSGIGLVMVCWFVSEGVCVVVGDVDDERGL